MPKRSSSQHRPFERLRDLVDEGALVLAEPDNAERALVVDPPKLADSLSDEEAFALGMEGVRPLGWSAPPLERQTRAPVPTRPETENEEVEEEDESSTLAELEAFVAGRGEMDPFAIGEGVEGAASRRGRRYLERLRRGDFSVQAHLDLHGVALEDVRSLLERFLRNSLARGYACVRIIHGRGRHSRAGPEPARMKREVTRWLSSRRLSRVVIAFASAPYRDGGGGAVYVLLYGKWRPPRSSIKAKGPS
jgi:DNA-nicking Smr family endonuclease